MGQGEADPVGNELMKENTIGKQIVGTKHSNLCLYVL